MPTLKPKILLIALALAAAATAPRPALDLSFTAGKSGHARVSLGFASVKIAFDSGQACSNSNGCAGAVS